jgi:5-methylcytosine-specific restriction endonuclease McrA
VRCGAPANTVDHIVGVALTGIEDVADEALQSLCRRCHHEKTARQAADARWHRDDPDAPANQDGGRGRVP